MCCFTSLICIGLVVMDIRIMAIRIRYEEALYAHLMNLRLFHGARRFQRRCNFFAISFQVFKVSRPPKS
ncbi:MAG: hypothetical protein II453_16795, partial [Alphaproteobacteria bacterium]|nr:hypothetical protein [Alphaproteobacteria bacterium]